MQTLLDLISIVGGLAGLGSAAFLIFDRAIRDRPRMVLHRKSIGANGVAQLRIINRADDDLLIRSINCSPPLIGIADDDKLAGTVKAVVGEMPSMIIVGPHAEAVLPVIKLKGSAENAATPIKISASWTRSRHYWPWPLTSTLRTTRAFLDQMEAARPHAPGAE